MGFDLIEIAALDPKTVDVDFTRRQLEKAGIGATASLGLEANEDISSNDRESEKRGRAKLEEAVAMARDVGATHVCGILESAFKKYDKPTTPEGVKRSVEVLQRVAEVAAKSNIILGLEVVNRYKSNVLNTASQAVEMCKRIGAPNVKAHLDVYHMNIEKSDIRQAIVETGDYLGYFHTGNSHRGYMGSGSIDLAGVFRALVTSGYQGPITFDSFSSRVVGQPLEGILGIWREPLGGQSRSCRTCADVHARPAQGGARGPQTGDAAGSPGLAMRGNLNAREPGPPRKRRDKLNRTTLFNDRSGVGARRHDLASRALAGDGEQASPGPPHTRGDGRTA